MSDHAAVAKRLQASNKVDAGDLNIFVNFGMISADGTSTQLQSVRHDTLACILRCVSGRVSDGSESTASVRAVLVKDPSHDSNKLYGVVCGLPRKEVHEMRLEEIGINEEDCRAPAVGVAGVEVEQKFLLSQFVGGRWIDPPNEAASSFNVPPDVPRSARLAFAASRADDSELFDVVSFSLLDDVVCLAPSGSHTIDNGQPSADEPAPAVSRSDAVTVQLSADSLLAMVRTYIPMACSYPGQLVVPIVSPIRLVGPLGVSFFG